MRRTTIVKPHKKRWRPASRTLRADAIVVLGKAEHAAWLKENAEAIDAHNERIEQAGLFNDGLHRF